jgi:hypothetical protein
MGAANTFTTTRSMTFLGPNAPASTAAEFGAQASAPLALTVTPFAP